MKKPNCLRWGLGIGVLLVALLCIVGVALVYFQRRSLSFNSRPLVLIQAPINHDRVVVGDGVLVHATAREDNGLQRMELWVDDELIAVRTAPAGKTASLAFSHSWSPDLAGTHVIVVRAFSSAGAPGQSTVTVVASASSELGPETHTVQEGETLQTIAADHGVTPDELAASNPGGAAAPGDALVIPEESGPSAGGAPSAGSDAPPPDEGLSPGSSNPLSDILLVIPFFSTTTESAEPTSLRLEVVGLQTSQAFDGLHCYVGMAGGGPRWLPDVDGDQTTDESFAPLAGGGWDVQPYLAGSAVPFLTWPGNQDLPLEISCVGVTGGGSDAVDLGRMQLSIPPAHWDGVIRTEGSDGEGGPVDMQYKVSRVGGSHGIPVWLDEMMTPPTNVHLDDRRISLRWDYTPRADEEPIAGFRIYLNGNLQWTEPADARESGLPYEWFHPRCGSPYTFGVTAYRIGFPDGPESTPGIAMVVTPVEDCDREMQVIFHSLETFELGGDGSPDHLSGDMGPVYGYFYANDRDISFDTRASGEGGGSLDMPVGLFDNTVYDLNELWLDPVWRFNSMPGTIVDVPPEGSLQLGFYIMDHDRSRDNVACFADSAIYVDNPATGALDQWHEETLTSDDGRCRLSYSFGPAMGSTVGSGVAGGEPLPWLDLQHFTVDEATGAVHVQLRNTGTATWPWKDLDVELRTRAGQTIATRTWTSFVLETGQERTLDFPDGTVGSPFDACVVIDPADKVRELYERTGSLAHGPMCHSLPDLSIAGVTYAAEHLRVTIENVGGGSLESRTLTVRTFKADGTPLGADGSWPDTMLGPGEARTFDLSGVTGTMRNYMRAGYSVVLDPDGTLAEMGTENNTYTVPGVSERLALTWWLIEAPYDARNRVAYSLEATAVSGDARREIVRWNIPAPIGWATCFSPRYCMTELRDSPYGIDGFQLFGDELLEIRITAAHAGEDEQDVAGTETYGPADNWGAGPVGATAACQSFAEASPSQHGWLMGYAEGHPWYTTFNLCLRGVAP